MNPRLRRSWSDVEKQRIVAEAFCAGASVADVARRHGMNANLISNWRKTMPTACTTSGSNITVATRREPVANPATENTSFVPIGVFARGDDGGPALRVETAPPGDGASVTDGVIQLAPGTKVYLACQPVSMRYGFDGLEAQVTHVLDASAIVPVLMPGIKLGTIHSATRDPSQPQAVCPPFTQAAM